MKEHPVETEPEDAIHVGRSGSRGNTSTTGRFVMKYCAEPRQPSIQRRVDGPATASSEAARWCIAQGLRRDVSEHRLPTKFVLKALNMLEPHVGARVPLAAQNMFRIIYHCHPSETPREITGVI